MEEKIKILKTIIILQIIFSIILMFISGSTIIAINNDEFNEILNKNTTYGFPKSNFIVAVAYSGLSRTAKVTVYNGLNTYHLDERPLDNEIVRYIRSHANLGFYLLGFNAITLFIIYPMIFRKYNKKLNGINTLE